MSPRVFVLGGARSGKSAFAESLLAGQPAVEYVATATDRPDDAEWAARIAAHRARRPASWRTVEAADVAAVLSSDGSPVLIDSITLWLADALDDPDLDSRTDELGTAWAHTSRFAVVVSDETGFGVVPETEAGRRFRDALGALNQRLAAAADEVHLVVAGIPLRLR